MKSDNSRDTQRFSVIVDPKGNVTVTRRVACLALIVTEGASKFTLAVTSRRHPEQMTLPKGGWELHEALPTAALREANEEAGLNISNSLIMQAIKNRSSRSMNDSEMADLFLEDASDDTKIPSYWKPVVAASKSDSATAASLNAVIPISLRAALETALGKSYGEHFLSRIGEAMPRMRFATGIHVVVLPLEAQRSDLLLATFDEDGERERLWLPLAARALANMKSPYDKILEHVCLIAERQEGVS